MGSPSARFFCLSMLAACLAACGGSSDRCAEECSNGRCADGLCACDEGYDNDSPTTCVDVDECTDGVAGCGDHATCENTEGSFVCTCDTGFEWDGAGCVDIDECLAGAGCDPNATCENTDGSFSCTCDAGYAGDGFGCADVDECAGGTDDCHALASCTNTDGGFTCACDPGYAGDGVMACLDVDECSAGTDDCHAHATCTNTDGAFTCACDAGYVGDGVTTCADVDECAEGTDDCHALAGCINTDGGFTCACAPGYAGDGVTACDDIDECAGGTDDCHASATCTNSDGGFSCTCDAGYVGDGVDTCDDVDECAEGTDNCLDLASCTNIPGGYTCVCYAGYAGDGVNNCDDVDECAEGIDNCHANATCSNTEGNFTCTCDAGYAGDGVDACDDVDECAEGTDDCHANATCTNTDGGFGCACDQGYEGDGVISCDDIDECAEGIHDCGLNATCVNAVPGYDCVCDDGYLPVGDHCERDCGIYQADFDTDIPASDQIQVDGFTVTGSDQVVSYAAGGLGVVGGDSDALINDGESVTITLPFAANRIAYRIDSVNDCAAWVCSFYAEYWDADGNLVQSNFRRTQGGPDYTYIEFTDTPVTSFTLTMSTQFGGGGYSINMVDAQAMEFHAVNLVDEPTGIAQVYTDAAGIVTITSSPRDLFFLLNNGIGVDGGTLDNAIDTDESVTLDFNVPIMEFVYVESMSGGAGSNQIEVFDSDGSSLGSHDGISSQFDIFGSLGITEFSTAVVHANVGGAGDAVHRLGRLGYGICR